MTITQSSGFGKSRVLYEVAKKIDFDMRLLYICAHNIERSSGFLVPTPKLSEFFFRDDKIGDRLLIALEFACAHRKESKEQWLGLFGMNADNTLRPTSTDTTHADVSQTHVYEHGVGGGNSQTLKTPAKLSTGISNCALALIFENIQRAQEDDGGEPSPKKSRSSAQLLKDDQGVQVLVLAIDETSSCCRLRSRLSSRVLLLGLV